MKFSLDQETFLGAVSHVLRATATRVIQPILAHIYIEADAATNSLILAATDLDIAIEMTVPNVVITQPGKTTINAKKLVEIISKLPKETIHLEADDTTALARITCRESVFDVRTLPADEFPVVKKLDLAQGITLQQSAFLRAIQHTVFAAASFEMNNVLAGVYFKLDGTKLEMAATDGSRLARSQEVLETQGSTTEAVSAIIPAKSLQEFAKMATTANSDTVSLVISDGQIAFQSGSVYMLSRLLDGQYPQYEQLIPKEYKVVAYANRQSLIRSLERAAVMANERTNIVKMTFDKDQLSLSAQTPDVGDSKDNMNIQYEGESLKIAFNYKYVLEALKVIETDDVRVELNGGLSPTLFKARDNNDYLCLVMPVQVK